MAIKKISVPPLRDNYIFIPACCYAGNRFPVSFMEAPYYPPMFRVEEAKIDMPVTITDVPRLQPDGSGKIEVTTGDAAVPCIGVFSPSRKKGLLVFTVQQLQGQNIGLAYEEGEIRLTWPAKREKLYRSFHLIENETPWEDLPADIPCRVLDFSCDSLGEFYRVFFENRKCMGLDCQRPAVLPFERQLAIQKQKFNDMNWYEELGIYMVGTDKTHFQVWEPGWTGGAMSSYPLMKWGDETEMERAMRTLSFLFSTQCESGFFHGLVDNEGNVYGDAFNNPGAEHWHLIRKSADVLYFLFKHFRVLQEKGKEIPAAFWEGARKTADGFVRLFRRYGQFGQFVDVHTGDICVGGSTSAGIAPAGLVDAWRFFGDPVYLQAAKESAEYYYQTSLSQGYTTGGPGEILQGVDSESGFGLLESYVLLYEETREDKWLRYARECAHYCSSWVVSYNYDFPPHSEFYRHHMKTVGSVFANIQNKHAAPGICTLSGDSLYKLWTFTGDPLYRELVEDIALTVGQYLSTAEKPIHDWFVDPEKLAADPESQSKHRLPPGFINERVNMSDWEGEARVGGVFHGSCWSETANMLCLTETIPLLQA